MAETTVADLVSLENEQATIGAMLIDPDAIGVCSGVVDGRDFHYESHRIIFDALLRLYAQGQTPDLLILKNEIGKDLDKVGTGKSRGIVYLSDLINKTPTALHCERYAKVVSRLATLRGLVHATAEIGALALNSDQSDELDELFARAQEMLDKVRERQEQDGVLLWLDALDYFFERQLEQLEITTAIEQGTARPRPTFPWAALRKYVQVIREGRLCVIMAPSSSGKTSMMENMAEYWAQFAGLNVAYFHCELSHSTMLMRQAARQSGVAFSIIERGGIHPDVAKANSRMRAWPGSIQYIHCPGWTAQRLCRVARDLWQRGKADAVIVDYFQKLRLVYGHGSNLAQAAGDGIEMLKNSAEQMGIPFVVGSQVTKKYREVERITGDLGRNTGEIEEKANIVVTINRAILTQDRVIDGEVVAREGQRDPLARIRLDKNTDGDIGDEYLIFEGSRFRFVDAEVSEQALNEQGDGLNF